MQIHIRYYARFREITGKSSETLDTQAASADALYRELDLPLAPVLVRVAVNDEFVPMSSALRDGDHVVFIPPVAGG